MTYSFKYELPWKEDCGLSSAWLAVPYARMKIMRSTRKLMSSGSIRYMMTTLGPTSHRMWNIRRNRK